MSEEGFLGRWSRRKREAARPPEPPPAPEIAAPEPVAPEAEPFDPASLPDPASLTAESDFAAFLRPGVPPSLRDAALRRAWTLDPAIRDFIESADYAWDYNAPDGGVPGFSPRLLGNMAQLIAQAVGQPWPPPEDAPEGVTLAEAPVADDGADGATPSEAAVPTSVPSLHAALPPPATAAPSLVTGGPSSVTTGPSPVTADLPSVMAGLDPAIALRRGATASAPRPPDGWVKLGHDGAGAMPPQATPGNDPRLAAAAERRVAARLDAADGTPRAVPTPGPAQTAPQSPDSAPAPPRPRHGSALPA